MNYYINFIIKLNKGNIRHEMSIHPVILAVVTTFQKKGGLFMKRISDFADEINNGEKKLF